MSGPTTSSKAGPTMEGSSACSISSTSSAGSAWRSGSTGSSDRPTSSTSCPISSSCAACRITSRSDNGPEFIAKAVREWIAAVGAKTAYIEPGSPLGERLLRELQLQTPRRAAQRGDLLQPRRGQDHHRELAPPLQHQAPTFIAGLSPPGSGGGAVAGFAIRSRFAGHPGRSAKTRHALRLKPDHPIGAGHSAPLKPSFSTQSPHSGHMRREIAAALTNVCFG